MKISTEINSAAKIIGEEKAIEYIAKAGFDAWDFSMFKMCGYDGQNRRFIQSSHPLAGKDYLKFARKLKQIGLDNGIVCNQSHAPHPTACDEIRSYCKRAIECTKEAGGKICVIHPANNKTAEENAQMYFELLDFAKSCDVKIATENMWNWDSEKDQASFAACATPESFIEHVDALNSEYMVACLDIGHAEMRGSGTNAVEMIKALGHRLKALHIHDNDKWKDLHQIPFSMNINFDEIIKALKEINYSGYFTLEAYQYLKDYTSDNIFDGIKKMSESARKLADAFDKN